MSKLDKAFLKAYTMDRAATARVQPTIRVQPTTLDHEPTEALAREPIEDGDRERERMADETCVAESVTQFCDRAEWLAGPHFQPISVDLGAFDSLPPAPVVASRPTDEVSTSPGLRTRDDILLTDAMDR